MPTELALDAAAHADDARPLVVHVVYRFDVGGLENGVVNLINHLPRDAFRHAIVAMTEVTDFRQRIRQPDVRFASLRKPPGQGLRVVPSLVRLLRAWKPAIVHTRNLAALEMQLAAWFAGVPVRIHGEHGRDVDDLHGLSRRHRWSRRLYRPLVQQQIALSRDLAEYLQGPVGVPAARVRRICNGVDTDLFSPSAIAAPPSGCPFEPERHFVVGTVGRMQTVKHQTLLVRAFVEALRRAPQLRPALRLALVGDGPLRTECAVLLAEAGVADLAWLPGARSDVPAVLRGLSAFALPSLAEGISNTVLEAMACGLPVIATDVGGNADLVASGASGRIVPSDDVDAMARAIVDFASDPGAARRMGAAGRARAEAQFSLRAMVAAYQDVYETQLRRAGWRREGT